MELSTLPSPIFIFQSRNAYFQIFQAKNMYDSQWSDEGLKQLVLQARQTYRDYYNDDIPLLDEYDPKSLVYLAAADYVITYEDIEIPVREWLSLRFLPADGTPNDSLDFQLQICEMNDKKHHLLEVLAQHLNISNDKIDEIRPKVVSHSRMCALRPHAIQEDQQELLQEYFEGAQLHKKNQYTAECFALMNWCFIQRQQSLDNEILYLTCQINDRVKNEVLSFQSNNDIKNITFSLTEEVVKTSHPLKIRTDRKGYENYIYSYPGYFLNIEEMILVLETLLAEGRLSLSTLTKYLPANMSWSEVKNQPHVYHFRSLGKLFTLDGKLPESSIQGHELRNLLTLHVSDNPKLYILPYQKFSEEIYDIVQKLTYEE